MFKRGTDVDENESTRTDYILAGGKQNSVNKPRFLRLKQCFSCQTNNAGIY